MYKVVVMDVASKKSFEKSFESLYLAQKWVRKLKYSVKLQVISTNFVRE